MARLALSKGSSYEEAPFTEKLPLAQGFEGLELSPEPWPDAANSPAVDRDTGTRKYPHLGPHDFLLLDMARQPSQPGV